ncbi:PAS domain-containing sensor histidine kinase [Candidatus Saccharibacteria bacterium]|nr:PAS domain-containing sensor histidine kinase [Candidatus Saccharibacteria bacterium]
MGPGHLENALKAIKRYIIVWFTLSGLALIGIWWGLSEYSELEPLIIVGSLVFIWIILSLIIGSVVANQTSKPLKALSEAILHVAPTPIPIAAPEVEKIYLARELVSNLIRQVYEYAASGTGAQTSKGPGDIVLQQLSIPVIGIDAEGNITFANPKANHFSKTTDTILGKNLYTLFEVLFKTNDNLDSWIKSSRENAVTAQKIWRGVRINPYGQPPQYFDMAVSYIKGSEEDKTEAIISLFEQTEIYSEEDKSLSFISLAVHELRTPLTILRGYIEVFDDELSSSLRPDQKVFMKKMEASAENLAAFVGNILNVAKIEQNQLSLHLNEEDWPTSLTRIVDNMKLRAEVYGKTIELSIAPNLPKVGIDQVSIAEVITNLIDNAIKYSPDDKTLIKVSSQLTKDGLVETTVQDFGVGIPTQVMPHLFEKFSRNYRNQAAISGTGLGLYLSKGLVNAHGGNIWARSKENEGTIIGFTILPFTKLADQEKTGNNSEITRNAHGWIKNHSLSRR